VEHQYPLLLFPPLLAEVAVPILLRHLSFRRTEAVEVIALIAEVTQDDLIIVRVTQADTAEARWTVQRWLPICTSLAICFLVRQLMW
jgi:hypothetical protein